MDRRFSYWKLKEGGGGALIQLIVKDKDLGIVGWVERMVIRNYIRITREGERANRKRILIKNKIRMYWKGGEGRMVKN